jgi:hypothetical protein
MNALQRALIEKAGYDNGWEVTLAKCAETQSSQTCGTRTSEETDK